MRSRRRRLQVEAQDVLVARVVDGPQRPPHPQAAPLGALEEVRDPRRLGVGVVRVDGGVVGVLVIGGGVAAQQAVPDPGLDGAGAVVPVGEGDGIEQGRAAAAAGVGRREEPAGGGEQERGRDEQARE